jgi:hypothetical protein
MPKTPSPQDVTPCESPAPVDSPKRVNVPGGGHHLMPFVGGTTGIEVSTTGGVIVRTVN